MSVAVDNEAIVSDTRDVTSAVILAVAQATIEKGQTYTFHAVRARSGDTLIQTLDGISGTCPKGSWSGSDYTTGVVTDPCTVMFATQNPCPTVIPETLNFTTHAKPIFVAANCIAAGCHNAGNGERAEFEDRGEFALGQIKDQPGVLNSTRILVKPTKPLESVVYLNISNDPKKNLNGRMPLGGTPLSIEDESTVCNWILQGAPN